MSDNEATPEISKAAIKAYIPEEPVEATDGED